VVPYRLEAIYAEGASGLRQQLVAKTHALFGPPQTHKKAFGSMYDFRSRFVHGDVDFPLAYDQRDYDQLGFTEEVETAIEVALAVLLATLQAMARSGSHRLTFTYVVTAETQAGDTVV
jgi:hypothetical protein